MTVEAVCFYIYRVGVFHVTCFGKDHLARALRTGIAFARMSGLERIMAHLKMKVRSQKTHGVAYSQQRETSKSCISAGTAALKLHSKGTS